MAAAWVLVTLPLVGVGFWADFVRAAGNVQPDCEHYGASVTCVAQPFLGIAGAKMAALAIAGAVALGAVFVRRDLLAFAMVALSWVLPAWDQSDYSLLPIFVVWVVVFAVGMRKLRSVEVGPPSRVVRRLAARARGSV
jgi:hypothetical protein